MFFNANRNHNNHCDCNQSSFRGKCGEGFFSKRENFKQMIAQRFGSSPSVNIEEREDAFLVCLYAAGLSKDKFKLSIQDAVLTISYEAENQDADRKFIYQENNLQSFERSFQLNAGILTEQISAAYIDGVLVINLPKDPEAKQAGQEIKIN